MTRQLEGKLPVMFGGFLMCFLVFFSGDFYGCCWISMDVVGFLYFFY